MVKRHILTVLAATFLTLSASASVKLGPEIPLLDETELQPAASNSARAASNGRDFLVVWEDARQSGPDIYATRVNAGAHPADQFGHHIALGSKPLVARSGDGYLIVWHTSSAVQSLRVDETGAPLASPRTLPALPTDPGALLSNGSTYLLVGERQAMLLDAEGGLVRIIDLPAQTLMGATVRDNRYLVMVLTPNGAQFALETIENDGTISATAAGNLPAQIDVTDRSAFGPSSILVATRSGYYVVGYDGRILKQPVSVATKWPYRTVTAAWDGRQFLLAFSSLDVIRVDPDGTAIDGSTFAISHYPSSTMAIASAGNRQLVVWNDDKFGVGGLVGRETAEFSSLAAVADPPTHLAYTGEAQFQPQIAHSPAGVFAVWSDPGRYEVLASFNGEEIEIDETEAYDWVGWPAVAAGNRVFLVAWRHNTKGEKDRLLAQRFDFSGHPLDAEPLVLDESIFNDSSQLDHTPPSIAFDGSRFFVASTRVHIPLLPPENLHTIGIGEEGSPFDALETVIASDPFTAGARSARALWTGSDFLVTTTADSHMATVRFDRNHTAISEVFGGAGLAGGPVATTRVGSRVTYAWADAANGISVAQASFDGTPIIAPRAIVQRTPKEPRTLAGIVWNGSEHVLVWLDTFDPESHATKLRAIRLDANLEPIDAAPFEIFSGAGPHSNPWLVPTPSGVLIAYSRSDAENGDQPRVFMRTLERLGAQNPRRRAAGR